MLRIATVAEMSRRAGIPETALCTKLQECIAAYMA